MTKYSVENAISAIHDSIKLLISRHVALDTNRIVYHSEWDDFRISLVEHVNGKHSSIAIYHVPGLNTSTLRDMVQARINRTCSVATINRRGDIVLKIQLNDDDVVVNIKSYDDTTTIKLDTRGSNNNNRPRPITVVLLIIFIIAIMTVLMVE